MKKTCDSPFFFAVNKAARQYDYDTMGNVTKIYGTTHGTHNYTYDERGFVTKDNDTAYTYDSNGNITKMGSVALTYDTVIKDRLMRVGGYDITYDKKNPLNPKSYKNITYKFNGRRLVNYNTRITNYDYKYNEQGLRTQKKWGSEITDYYYDGQLLITEIAPTYRLDFLYDENSQLYGFIKDNTDKYFYVRDCLMNIIGIIDSAGQLVVQYDYTAYGKVSIKKDTNGIGELNPFRFKGYYYDRESLMYYCHSRYYVPDWGRWLNADSPEYLQIGNPSCVNLFAYCNNNPVMYADRCGTSAWSDFWNSIGNWFVGVGDWINDNILQPTATFFKENWDIVFGVALVTAGVALSVVTFGASTCLAGVACGAIIGGLAGGLNAYATGGDVGQGIFTGMAVGFLGGIYAPASGLAAAGMYLLNDRMNGKKAGWDSLGRAALAGISAWTFAKAGNMFTDSILHASGYTLLNGITYVEGVIAGTVALCSALLFSFGNWVYDLMIGAVRGK